MKPNADGMTTKIDPHRFYDDLGSTFEIIVVRRDQDIYRKLQ